jgi:hypothetical protein
MVILINGGAERPKTASVRQGYVSQLRNLAREIQKFKKFLSPLFALHLSKLMIGGQSSVSN